MITYSWRVFECEICKKPYPSVFRLRGRSYRLADLDIPEHTDFLWLEQMNYEKNSSKNIYIIKPSENKNEFKMGRGHDADVRIGDISVSRCHAIIKLEND